MSYAIEMLNITKEFPGIKANDNVTLQVEQGEIHALLGENGAGKSTLMSILFGLYQPDEGQIKINGEPLALKDLFHQEITEGKCKLCTFELVLLLDKLGIYSEAVYAENKYFKGTTGSYSGGHWYVEAYFEKKPKLIDTSLVITGTEDAFTMLGHKIIKKYDIDSLFKENSELIDYYDQMIIHK